MQMSLYVLLVFVIGIQVISGGCERSETTNLAVHSGNQSVVITPTPQKTSVIVPSSQDEMLSKARGLQARGEAEAAISIYNSLIEANHPEKVEIHRSVAEIYLGLKQFDRAASNYESILKIDPDDVRARFAFAAVLIEHLNRCEQGLQAALRAKKEYGDDGQKYVRDRLIGRAYDCLGNRLKAIEYYNRFLKGASFAPDSDDYQSIKKRVRELTPLRQNDKD